MRRGQPIDDGLEGYSVFGQAGSEQHRCRVADGAHALRAGTRRRGQHAGQQRLRPCWVESAADLHRSQCLVGIEAPVAAALAGAGVDGQALRTQALLDCAAVRRGQQHHAGIARLQAVGNEITGGVSRVGVVIEVDGVSALHRALAGRRRSKLHASGVAVTAPRVCSSAHISVGRG